MPEGDWLWDRVRHSVVAAPAAPVSYIEGTVHQAIGMVMEYVGCSALPALELLDAEATETGRSLYLVAVETIERRYPPEPPDRA